MSNKPVKKEFQINSFITLELVENKTILYVNNKEFKQCKILLLNIPSKKHKSFNEINSIDDAEVKFESAIKRKIEPETEFWGHCSNIQAWVENGYATELLHKSLAFPLLKSLTNEGDQVAKLKFKEEITRRYKYGNYSIQSYLFNESYLSYLSEEDILNGILRPEDSIVLEKIKKSREKYSLIPCFDSIRDLNRENELFFSIKDGKINEIEIVLNKYLTMIPHEIENLSEIYKLNLYITDYCKNIFVEKFKNDSITDLEIVCYEEDIIIPDSFSYFPKLERLRIHGRNCRPIVDLESSLKEIKNLKYLVLSNINLANIPDSIQNLNKLIVLELRDLPIRDVPVSTIINLESLKTLDLRYNPNLKISETDIKRLEEAIESLTYIR